jgi:hypothetical protein
MKKLLCVVLCSVLGALTSNAKAASINSAPFSFGYGFNSETWNDSETSGSNTLTTLGGFTFTPAVGGTKNSNTGPTFGGRVLTDGGNDQGGRAATFTLDITGAYTGGTPGDAAVDPDYQIKLHITQLSIFGASFYNSGDPNTVALNFAETTPDHGASQASQVLPNSGGSMHLAASYAQVVWDPADFFSAIDTVTQTRSFILQSSDSTWENLEGLEIFGYVELSYIAIPEPTGLSLAGMAFLGLAALRRRMKA